MPEHVQNREKIISHLKEELVGPRPVGPEVDCMTEIEFEESYRAYEPYRQKRNGDEILTEDRPSQRYGVGVLNPAETAHKASQSGSETEAEGEEAHREGTENDSEEGPDVKTLGGGEEAVSDDLDLTMTNASRSCSMAVSFLASLDRHGKVEIQVSGGRYHRKDVKAGDDTNDWWRRSQVRLKFNPEIDLLRVSREIDIRLEPDHSENAGGLNLSLEVFSRPQAGDRYLLTVALVNRTEVHESQEEATFFQSHFRVGIADSNGEGAILPYPQGKKGESLEGSEEESIQEEESLELIYRKSQTFAVGHGCAADWEKPTPEAEMAREVSAECFPVYEAPSMTPEVRKDDGSLLKVSMGALAGLQDSDGFDQLQEVVSLYSDWIEEKRSEISALDDLHHEAARRHMDRAERCVKRMRDGIELLNSDPTVRKAFRLANHAILLQQIRSFREARSPKLGGDRLNYRDHPDPDPSSPGEERGDWRPFQIAFLLMVLRSTAEKGHPSREEVELIWFPTGGGKTEAYLGLAAFSIFLRYLRDPNDTGVQVVTRYTLRLLTAQQFQRTSGLVCAMEYLRRRKLPEVEDPISIGIWVGGKTSPNTRNQAKQNLRDLRDDYKNVENKFILNRCPWCGASMGRIDAEGGDTSVAGYRRQRDTVRLTCPDRQCEFRRGLPVYVIDEDIYEERPDIVIGTVDKFAMLAWRPEARKLFGFDEEGERISSPPGLIIQDELHLISGPLGSMVGLYETLIEELCTDRRKEDAVSPKIVCSTATIRRYEEQIEGLYSRDEVTLFPPPGLERGDSFFSRHATDEKGQLLPGKKFVGIYAPGLPSLQTVQVNTFSSLLTAPVPFSDSERDPWWTLLVFYNSLRELGGALSLFQSDIPEHIRGIAEKMRDDRWRPLKRILELTGRISGEEVTEAISDLETTTTGNGEPVHACLASSIVEVGVDIDRLSLMAVVGQPKTTSQYIQVTGRVGRKWRERPGLVTTLYSTSKPRDRSHFEKFRSYHERLHAQVEPTSVTPFSPPALNRALHAIMVAYVRQYSETGAEPYPAPVDRLRELKSLLRPRVKEVDPGELETFDSIFEDRLEEWKRRERINWTPEDEDPGLMHRAGKHVPERYRNSTWAVPMNMRNVDPECVLEISDVREYES